MEIEPEYARVEPTIKVPAGYVKFGILRFRLVLGGT